MTEWQNPTTGRAAELRRAFDQAFSEPPVGGVGEMENLLALRSGGDAYAVRLAEISAFFTDRTTVHLPSPVPEFLGVAGLRNDVVPVYGLRGLLGHAMGGEPPRWLIVARATHPVAFAFEQFDGYLRVPPSAVFESRDRPASTHVPASVRLGDGLRGVVSIASLIRTIEDRNRHPGTTKEQ